MKNILFRWSFFTTLFFISTNLVFAGCSTENQSFNGFSSKTTTCSGEKSNTVYYLGNLEITSQNYIEQIKLYKEKYATCPATSHDKMQKTKGSRMLAKVCVQGEQPSKYLIDSNEVTFQEYVLAFFADFFNFYPNKASQINSNQIKIESQQTNGSKCINLTKTLSKGSENSEVLKLQQFLFDGGYLTVKPNGYFGSGTVTALKKFQLTNSMSPVGSVGPMTRSKIKEVSCTSGSSKISTVSNVMPVVVNEANLNKINETDVIDSINVINKKVEDYDNNYFAQNKKIPSYKFNVKVGGKWGSKLPDTAYLDTLNIRNSITEYISKYPTLELNIVSVQPFGFSILSTLPNGKQYCIDRNNFKGKGLFDNFDGWCKQ